MDEPQGIGAVVEVGNGPDRVYFVRVPSPNAQGNWVRVNRVFPDNTWTWDKIVYLFAYHPVHVRFEGYAG